MKSAATRRLLTALVVVCLLVPAWSMAGRVIFHFVANFNVKIDPGVDIPPPDFEAKGGTFAVQGPPNLFDIVVDGTGEGVLLVFENVFGTPGTLIATLNDPAYDSIIDMDVMMTPSGSISDLIISLIDDDNGGMIDLEFDDEDGGKIIVDGESVQIGSPGESAAAMGDIAVSFRLKASLFNVNTWSVTVSGSFGTHKFSGFLSPTGPLSLAHVKFIRPGNTTGGGWALDDLVVSSPSSGGLNVY